MDKNFRFYLIFPVIFLAGFCFLCFEISWFRTLTFLIGSSVSASTIVLSAFMLGMGLGALFWNNFLKNSVGLFAKAGLQFFIISFFGIVSWILWKSEITSKTMPNEWIIFTISIVFLLLSAFFIGGIIPTLTSILQDYYTNHAKNIGIVYALETVGSVTGGLLTAFVFIKYIGQQNTLLFATLCCLGCGFLIFFLQQKNQNVLHKPINTNDLYNKNSIKHANRLWLVIFVVGFVNMSLQVVLLRVFKVYFTNNSYSFALISTLAILGVSLGSFYFKQVLSKKILNLKTIYFLLLVFLFFQIANLVLVIKLPHWILFPLENLQSSNLGRIIFVPSIAISLLILPSGIISGIIVPAICSVFPNKKDSLFGNAVGKVLGINMLGASLGPITITYIIIPFWGVINSLIFLLGFLLVVLWILLPSKEEINNQTWLKATIVVGFALLLVWILFKPNSQILPPSFLKLNRQVLAYQESIEGNVIVGREYKGKSSVLSAYVNNSAVIGTNYDAIKAVKMVGHLPFLQGKEKNEVLVIGFGIGVTTAAIATHKEVKQIDCVELIPGLINVAHYFEHLNYRVYKDKRFNFMGGDGRHYLHRSAKKYDLISCDPTHPVLGSSSLYTKEYFELCKVHLNAGGVISQYLPLHKLLFDDFIGIVKTFASVFPHSSVWLGQYHAILLGTTETQKIDFQQWTDKLKDIKDDKLFYNNPYHLASNLLLGSEKIKQITENAAINSDNKSFTEFFNTDAFNNDNLAKNFELLINNKDDVNNTFFNIADSTVMKRFLQSTALMNKGLLYMLQGNQNGFKQRIEEAIAANPDDEELPVLKQLYFAK